MLLAAKCSRLSIVCHEASILKTFEKLKSWQCSSLYLDKNFQGLGGYTIGSRLLFGVYGWALDKEIENVFAFPRVTLKVSAINIRRVELLVAYFSVFLCCYLNPAMRLCFAYSESSALSASNFIQFNQVLNAF